jgi:hypothetical protein
VGRHARTSALWMCRDFSRVRAISSHFSFLLFVLTGGGALPGATMYQNEKDLEMVENLAKSYIEDERTIIL